LGQRKIAFLLSPFRSQINRRRILPAEQLEAALDGPARRRDYIQIQQGASPGQLTTAMLPNIPNLTIQGDPTVRPDKFATPITIDQDLEIHASNQGLTFKHVPLVLHGARIEFFTDGKITDSWHLLDRRAQLTRDQNALRVACGSAYRHGTTDAAIF
jgi:hypothetical protein